MTPIIFALLSLFSFSADVSARKLLEPLPALPSKKLLQEEVGAKPPDLLAGLVEGRLVVDVQVDGSMMKQSYLPFFRKDYVPKGDGSQALKLVDIKGNNGSGLVADMAACGKLCSDSPECNVASYYIEGSALPGGKNCYLKTADFMGSNLTACTLPPDASDNPDAVLLVLEADICKNPTLTIPGETGTGESGGTGGSTGAGTGDPLPGKGPKIDLPTNPGSEISTTTAITSTTETTDTTDGEETGTAQAPTGQESTSTTTPRTSTSAASTFGAVGISSFFFAAVAMLM